MRTHKERRPIGGSLGALPVSVEAVPLEGGRDAGRWIQRVMAIDAGLVVVDCPPHLSHATEAAVGVADLVIIPVTPSGADLVATASAVQLIVQARGARKDSGPGVSWFRLASIPGPRPAVRFPRLYGSSGNRSAR